MNKYIFFQIIFLLILSFKLKSLSESEMLFLAHRLGVTVASLKASVACWKNIKKKETLYKVFKKKEDKSKQILKDIKNIVSFNTAQDVISIYDILLEYPEIEYIKVLDKTFFKYDPFLISPFPQRQESSGFFAETFILKIPHGKVYSNNGYILFDNKILLECLPTDVGINLLISEYVSRHSIKQIKKVYGRVAVIAVQWSECYFHWITEVLARLLMLHQNGIEYDFLYVPCDMSFMRESLENLGIDFSKILPMQDSTCIEADVLIVPSYPANKYYQNQMLNPGRCGVFVRDWVLRDLREKFLSGLNYNSEKFSKKVFISRKDASRRYIVNEDELYMLLASYGFKKYELSNMSFLEQVALFHGAEYIVGAHGAGLTNLIFCKSGTKILEIFQNWPDCSYCYLSQQLKLNYFYLKSFDFCDQDPFKNTLVKIDQFKKVLDIFLNK